MYNRKALRRFLPGGINDGGGWDFPSGTFRPFDLGTGNANNIGSNTNGYANTRQGKMDEIFDAGMGLGSKPSSIPKSNPNIPSNPFANMTVTGTASRADLDPETGLTVDENGTPFENWTPPTSIEDSGSGESDLIIQKGKTKRLGAFGGEEFVNLLNAGTRFGLGIANNIATNKLQKENALDMAAVENAVGSTTEIDEGDYHQAGQELGQFRRRGQDRNSRATYGNFAGDTITSKYGGYMQDGGSSGYRIGQEVTMTPKQLEDFLRAGGEVDYI